MIHNSGDKIRPMGDQIDILKIDTAKVRATLTAFIRSQLAAAGYSRALVGLSGGLDSAVSCALSVEALGAEKVSAIAMPYATSSPQSLADAKLVAQQFKVPLDVIDITPVAQPLMDQTPDMTRLRRGNIMARTRMMVLYDQSEAKQALVIGTGNKTEGLLGYTTLWGDMACALNPVGDLYKTQMRQLAADMKVPASVISKPPSADLWPGQTDEGELGVTYEEVDKLLHLLVDRALSPDQCIASGFASDLVLKVTERIRRNNFKRVMPPIAMLDMPDGAA